MALDDHAHDAVLQCGTVLDDLILQVTEGRPPLDAVHQASCESCAHALELVRATWEEFLELARSTVEVPNDLVQRVTHQIQSLAAPSRDGVTVASAGGETLLRHEVLRRIARAEVLGFPDIALATVTVDREDAPPNHQTRLRLRLVIRYGAVISELVDAVRRRLAAVLVAQAGVTGARIDVEIADIVLGDEDCAPQTNG